MYGQAYIGRCRAGPVYYGDVRQLPEHARAVQQETIPWHALAAEEGAARLGTDPTRGLLPEEAARRVRVVGRNELPDTDRPNPVGLLAAQFRSALVGVLLVAAVVSLLLGNGKEAVAIGAVVVLNAVLGFVQEYRAERAMAALRRVAVPRARVRRAGRVEEVSSTSSVPGDVIFLEAGDRVPADARVVEVAGLRTDESTPTGESVPVEKDPLPVEADTPVAERRGMVYMGTVITAGRGMALVVATGVRNC